MGRGELRRLVAFVPRNLRWPKSAETTNDAEEGSAAPAAFAAIVEAMLFVGGGSADGDNDVRCGAAA